MLISKCLICESEYQPFVDFGDMPIANAFAKKEELNESDMRGIFDNTLEKANNIRDDMTKRTIYTLRDNLDNCE